MLGGAPARFPTSEIVSTRNPFYGTYLCVCGIYHKTVYCLHDWLVYRRCLQYLVHCGADLGIRSVERETARDIAVRMRKMALLEVIEDACECTFICAGDILLWLSCLHCTTSVPQCVHSYIFSLCETSCPISSEVEHQTFNLRVAWVQPPHWACTMVVLLYPFFSDDLRVSNSGRHVEHGSSMLRPSQSYPPACPRWMHRQASSTSLLNS